MSSPIGYIDTLESYLSRFAPGLKLFREHGSDRVEVWLPENPGTKRAESAVNDAWELNRKREEY